MPFARVAVARAYFAVQAAAVVGWWIALVARPQWRVLFQPADSAEITLLAFAPGDLLVLGVGGLFIALRGDRPGSVTRVLAWLVAGATIYAALYTASLALADAAPIHGAVLMCPAALASTYSALIFDDHFRSLPSRGAG